MSPGRGSCALHSSTNGKTGIHVNGLRGLCRPLPPHSCLLLLPLFFLSPFHAPSCSCRAPSPFLHAQPLLLPPLHSLPAFLSSLYFQIPISVIRTASLDEILFIDASPRATPCSSFPPRYLRCHSSCAGCISCSCVRSCNICMYVCMCTFAQLNALSSEISTVPRASFHENFVPRDQR